MGYALAGMRFNGIFYNISLRSCGEQASEVGEMDCSLFK